MCNSIQSCVIYSGLTTDNFILERGVRQGDPRSAYLFMVEAETLAIAIHQKTEIRGEDETKLLQYADSAQALFNILGVFKKLSGLVIN